jgi:hypothetical protein
VFDDRSRPVHVNEYLHARSDEPSHRSDDTVMETVTFDEYAAKRRIGTIDLVFIDESPMRRESSAAL